MSTMDHQQLWEDKYLNLKQEHEDLKKKCNWQETTIKRLTTKLTMIDSTLKRKGENSSGGHANGAVIVNADGNPYPPQEKGAPPRLDKDTEALIVSLRRQNKQLKQDKLRLSEELRLTQEQLRRKHPNMMNTPRRPSSASVNSGLGASTRGGGRGSGRGRRLFNGVESGGPLANQSRQKELIEALKQRLLNTEERMQQLHSKNSELRNQLDKNGTGHQHNNSGNRLDMDDLATGGIGGGGMQMTMNSNSDSHMGGDLISLQRDIKDKSAQVLIMRGRYDHLEAKARAAAEIHERTVHMLEESNRTIRDLRRKIQALQHENESLVIHQQRAEEMQGEVQELKDESRLLEERMATLCESPFINDAFENRNRVEKLLNLERQDRQQRIQIDHLKETAKMHHVEILALKSTTEQLAQQRDDLLSSNDTLRIKNEQLERGSSIMEEKMLLYSGDGDVDATDLEQALTLVKRRQEDPSHVDFLINPEGDDALVNMHSLPGMKRKLQELQIAHLGTARELERAERMLKAQTNINKELNSEISELTEKLNGEQSELLRKLDDYETLAAKRLHKVHALEAQVKQLMNVRGNGGVAGAGFENSALRSLIERPRSSGHNQNRSALAPRVGPNSSSWGGGGIAKRAHKNNTSMNDDAVSILSLSPSDADFGPGENLVEIWVIGAKLVAEKMDSGATTFVMVDFLDFESQTSPLLTGLEPDYNFAATYKVEADHFFVRYLATERLVIEVNRTRHTDFELVGRVSLSLRPLLDEAGRMSVQEAEVVSVVDGSILGTLKVKVRLALPVNELFDLYLREHPQEKERMRMLKQADQDEAEEAAARARAQNQLEVTVLSCNGLNADGSDSAALPSPYVHYQLLSFADSFTQAVPSSCNPVFDHTLPYPLNVDRKLLRFLRREKLHLNIFDESQRLRGGRGDEDEGLLGTARIRLAPLADGKAVEGSFPVVDAEGRPCGGVKVRIAWRSPLSLEDVGGPMALSSEQLNAIFNRYDQEGSGQVGWRRFLKEMALPDQQRAGLQARLRQIFALAKEREVDYVAVLAHHDHDQDGRLTVSEVERALSALNMRMGKDEGMVVHMYLAEKDNRINITDLLDMAEAPSQALLTAERKVRGAFAELDARGVDVESPFAERNYAGAVSRKDFKLGLVELGFILFEEEKMKIKDPRAENDWMDGGASDEESQDGDEIRGAGNDIAGVGGSDDDGGNELMEGGGERRDGDKEPIGMLSRAEIKMQEREQHFVQRKKEFEERMIRARLATAATVDVDEYDDVDDARQSAVALQRTFRGFQERKRRRQGANAGASNAFGSSSSGGHGNQNLGASNTLLVKAEEALRVALAEAAVRSRNGRGPDLRALFAKHDNSRAPTGLLSHRKFQRAMDESNLELAEAFVAALANEFDVQGKVDYTELVKFVSFAPRDIALIADQLRHAILRVSTADAFKKFDANNDGVVTAREFKEGLRNLDFFDLSDDDIGALIGAFDCDGLGEIDYLSFVRFAQQQPMAVELAKVEGALRGLLARAEESGVDVQMSFRQFDKNKDGVISRKEFRKVLRDLKMDLNQNQVRCLFARFDPLDKGVIGYDEFVRWMRRKTDETNNADATDGTDTTSPSTADISNVDMQVLQKLCMNTVRKAANKGNGVLYAFEHYDWRARGNISPECFGAALLKAGFFLSSVQIWALTQKFGDPNDSTKKNKNKNNKSVVSESSVLYRDFVRWATPAVSKVSTVVEKLRFLIHQSAARAGNNKNSQVVASGVDFRPSFQHFDTNGTGEVSRRDFQAGMVALNWDLTEEELRAVMDEFDSDGDGYIQYDEFVDFVAGGGRNGSIGAVDKNQAGANMNTPKANSSGVVAQQQLSDAARSAVLQVVHALEKRQANGQYGDIEGENSADLFAPLDEYDTHKKGRVTVNDFETGLIEMGVVGLNASAVRALLETFSLSNRKGFVDVTAFRRVVQRELLLPGSGLAPGLEHQNQKNWGNFAPDGVVNVVVRAALSDFRREVLRVHARGNDHRVALERFDVAFTGEILDREFKQGLETAGIAIDAKHFRALCVHFAASTPGVAGRVKYREILQQVATQDDTRQSVMAAQVFHDKSRRRAILADGSFHIEKFLKHFQNTRSGEDVILSHIAFKKGLESLDLGLSDTQIRMLIDRFSVPESTSGDQAAGTFIIRVADLQQFIERSDAGLEIDNTNNTNLIGSSGRNEELNTKQEQFGGSLMQSFRRQVAGIVENGTSLRRAFERSDADMSGHVSSSDFVLGVRAVGIDASKRALQGLCAKYDNGEGQVDYLTFVHDMQPLTRETGWSSSGSDTHLQENTRDIQPVWRLAEELRLKIRAREMETGNLNVAFAHFAEKKKNNFKMKDLGRGMAAIGLVVDKNAAEQLFLAMDLNGDGKITFEEFAVYVRDPNYADVERSIRTRIMNAGGQWPKPPNRVFERVDRDKEGAVDEEGLDKALKRLGLNKGLHEEALRRIINRYDAEGDGWMAYDNFVSMLEEAAEEANAVRPVLADLRARVVNLSADNVDAGVNGGWNRPGHMLVTFGRLDHDCDGEVSRDEFVAAMDKLGFQDMGDGELKRLIEGFDFRKNGRVCFKELIEMVDPVAKEASERKQLEQQQQQNINMMKSSTAVSRSNNGSIEGRTDDVIERMRDLINGVLRAGISPRRAFERFDTDFDGIISASEFKAGLKAMLVGNNTATQLSNEDTVLLAKKFASAGESTGRSKPNQLRNTSDNRVDYIAFIHTVQPHRCGVSVNQELWRLEEAFRSKIRAREVETGDLRSPYSHFADKRKRAFGVPELGKGMSDIGLKVNKSQAQRLLEMIDLNNDGQISYEEFAVFVRDPDYSVNVEKHVSRAVLAVCIENEERNKGPALEDPLRIFRSYDKNRAKLLNMSGVSKAVNKLGLGLNEDAIKRVINRYDETGDGLMSYEPFAEELEANVYRSKAAAALLIRVRQSLLEQNNNREQVLARMMESFMGIDSAKRNGSIGMVDENNLISAFKHGAGIQLSKKEARKIADCFAEGNIDGDGRNVRLVKYQDLLQFLLHDNNNNNKHNNMASANASSLHDSNDPQVNLWVDRLRRLFLQAKRRGVSFHQSFEHFDVEYSGEISRREFLRGLDELNITLPQDSGNDGDVAEKVFERFAGHHKNSIKYRNFLNVLVPPDEVETERLINILQQILQERTADARGNIDPKRFARLFKTNSSSQKHGDDGGIGDVISNMALKQGLQDLGLSLQDCEFRQLLDVCDIDGKGFVSVDNLTRLVTDGNTESVNYRNARRNGSISESDPDLFSDSQSDAENGDVRSRSKSLSRGRGARNGQNERVNLSPSPSRNKGRSNGVDKVLQRMHHALKRSLLATQLGEELEIFDRKYRGTVRSRDLKQALASVGVDVTDRELGAIMCHFAGRRGHSEVRYREFIRAVAPLALGKIEEVADKFQRMLRRTDIKRAFKHFERQDDGTINGIAFRRGLQALDFDLNDKEVRVLLEMLDINRSGTISYSEFKSFAEGGPIPSYSEGGGRNTLTSSRSPSRSRSTSSRRGSGRAKRGQYSNGDDESEESGDDWDNKSSGSKGRTKYRTGDKRPYAGPPKKADAAHAVVIGLDKLRLAPDAIDEVGQSRVLVEIKLGDFVQQTPTFSLSSSSRNRGVLDLEHTSTFPCHAGSRFFRHLAAMARKSDGALGMEFRVMKVTGSSGKAVTLGMGVVDLTDAADNKRATEGMVARILRSDDERDTLAMLTWSLQARQAVHRLVLPAGM